jgi:hypothetical protein
MRWKIDSIGLAGGSWTVVGGYYLDLTTFLLGRRYYISLLIQSTLGLEFLVIRLASSYVA